jgi:predicted ribosomally synthesized peptide with nif11-like leader
MSQEKLQAFAEAVNKSEELQKRVALIQMETLRSTAEKVAKLSENAGTPFTAEEYLNSVAESSEQLSTEQLRSVAGGGTFDEMFGNIMNSVVKGLSNPANCAIDVARSLVDKGTPLNC